MKRTGLIEPMASATTTRIAESNGHDTPYRESDEADLLACVMYKPGVLPEVLKIVSPRCFGYPPNAIIFRHMVDIQSRGLSADPLLLVRQIDEAGDFEDIDGGAASGGTAAGGRAYLWQIADGATGVDNSIFYAEKIREKFEQRRLTEKCHLAIKRLGDGESFDDVRQFLTDDLRTCGGAGPVLTWFSDIKLRQIEWLWQDRIALGKTTNIQGNPGDGKSVFTIDLSARVSTGYAWPDARDKPTKPGSVILLSAEDDPNDTIKPRLVAAGADVSKVAVLSSCILDGNDRPKSLPDFVSLETDLAVLEAAILEAKDCRLVVVDPISAYLPKINSHVDAELRSVLKPLSTLAMKHGVAIVNVMHLNKSEGKSALNRGMGSLAFNAAARAVWQISRDKDDKSKRLFLPVKNNIAPACKGLAFTVVSSEENPTAPVISWYADAVDISADEALDRQPQGKGKKLVAATDWLAEILASGPVLQSEIGKRAKDATFGWRTVLRAKSDLEVVSKKDGYQSKSRWHLPSAEEVFE